MAKHLFYSLFLILLSTKIFSQDTINKTIAIKTNELLSAEKKNTVSSNFIDCNYKISPEMSHVDPAIIVSWAEYATIQSFNLDFASLDTQLNKLQSCYTKRGGSNCKMLCVNLIT
ncbi:hypothetical protein [Legionella norrlandica]|uniref:hypothetical protein n=1 Tax=Legionella norrlandica TaxID=1498499 RepID=UPI000B11E0D6|nr:hypothetical protein [Legionella norrlandica]